VQGETSFVILRFLLGVAEAGFFPGILLYLSKWFPRRAIARANTAVILGLPVAVLIGAPLSSWLISVSHGMFNITGWRWMFLIEGGAAIVIGIVAYFKLTDDVDNARFLNTNQKAWLRQKIDGERETRERIRTYTVLESLTNPKVLILAFAILPTLRLYSESRCGCRWSYRKSGT
jgi:ACS family tartrate transporter-like MFS transporter